MTQMASEYAGILACLDGYMNIAMEQTEVGYMINPVLTPLLTAVAA